MLDTTVVINLHSLGLIGALCSAVKAGALAAHCTSHVSSELVPLAKVHAELQQAGLQIHAVTPNDPAGQELRRLIKERGHGGRNNRGELSLIAFASKTPTSFTLVLDDVGAQRKAAEARLPWIHVSQLVCELVCLGSLAEEDARQALKCWDNKGAGNGRPRDYRGFDALLSSWRAKRS